MHFFFFNRAFIFLLKVNLAFKSFSGARMSLMRVRIKSGREPVNICPLIAPVKFEPHPVYFAKNCALEFILVYFY